MKDKAFCDTNVFVYAFSSQELEKYKTARAELSKCLPVISQQVLCEYSNVSLRKFGEKEEVVKNDVEEILGISTFYDAKPVDVLKAIDIHKKYGYTFYDSMIITAALQSGCRKLYTEDMNDGQMIEDKLEIVNIFADEKN
ncbi:hypothetical protein FACS189425_07970 [Clostridia bacterium]|nr:hypothetical protein FACS189425_07970 [Clostridia bacterium]